MWSAGGLQVSGTEGTGAGGVGDAFVHLPVLVDRVVELFGPVPAGVVVDATIGGGGHAGAILRAHPHLDVLGLDRDADALVAAGEHLRSFGDRVTLRHVRFDRLGDTVAELADTIVTGVLFDLGVSSPQLDRADRGFSYRHDAPLDMRMDRRSGPTAADLLAELDADAIGRILRRYGDERYAGRIARAVVAARPVTTTRQLAEVVREAIPAPARRRGGHPAKRTFQALRIAVNDELEILAPALDQAIETLVSGGRCVALAYHSGEDRIVKERFRHHATGGWRGPAHLPPPPEVRPTVRLLKQGAWKATPEEAAANPRAESVRLRAVEKLPLGDAA
jgi:16S rRNA (cytosine1402-N4)-methyltransferase